MNLINKDDKSNTQYTLSNQKPIQPKPQPSIQPKPQTPIQSNPQTPTQLKPQTPTQALSQTPIQPKPQTPIQPKPQTPMQPKPQTPIQALSQTPIQPKPQTPSEPKPQTSIQPAPYNELESKDILKKYILNNKIEQIYISNSLIHLKERFCNQYNLKFYNDINKPSLFFGVYSINDFNIVTSHKSFTYIMLGGTDIYNFKTFNINKNIKFISISKNIQELLTQKNIKSEYINLNLVDYNYKDIKIKNKHLWNEFCNINKINKVYIINLKRRPDRLFMMKFKLEKIGIYNYEIVDAVDGYTDENKFYYKKYKENVLLDKDPKINNISLNKPAVNSEGAYGLLLTYKKLLSKIDNNENIIIFEDDIVFHKNFYENLFKYNSTFFLSNDIVYLGGNHPKWHEETENQIKKDNYYTICKKQYYWTYGTYSIFLTPKIINIIKMNLTNMLSSKLVSIDILLWFICADMKTNIKSAVLYPNLILPQIKESDNMGARDISLLASDRKWKIEDYDFLDITSDFKSIYDSIISNKISLRQKKPQIDKNIKNWEISKLVENKNKTFVFIIASFNNAKYYIKNLESVFNQKYPFWRAIYIDDFSTDNTYNLVKQYIKKRGFDDKVILIKNEKNMKQAYSRYIAYNMCQNDEICCLLDGDDWLYNNNVLNVLNKNYVEHNLLVSYGQFYYYEKNKIQNLSGHGRYKEEEIKNSNFNYRNVWITQHLRTCETSLLKTIPESYLKFNGEWLQCCTDKAEMWWVLEKAKGRHRNIGSPTYVYNKDNSLQYDNSYYNKDKELKWKKYREDVENYLKNYKQKI
jgi:glycosyltransferase involved in cell wall biosynthesis